MAKEIRIRFPNIVVEEEDEPKTCTNEVFKAVADNDENYLETLIKEGFAVNLRDIHNLTPLHTACARGQTIFCIILLNNGAFLNATTGVPHKTALHIAVSGGYFDIVQLLIKKYKADWKITDAWGWNILHEAAASPDKNILMIRYIMKECKDLLNQSDKLGRSPLLLGLLSNIGEDAVSALLEMGEDPCKEDEVGRGCLEAAILYCNIHVVKLILKAYLSKEALDSVTKKLMMEIASDRPDSEIVTKMLMENTK